jgi:hypothetical protein
MLHGQEQSRNAKTALERVTHQQMPLHWQLVMEPLHPLPRSLPLRPMGMLAPPKTMLQLSPYPMEAEDECKNLVG